MEPKTDEQRDDELIHILCQISDPAEEFGDDFPAIIEKLNSVYFKDLERKTSYRHSYAAISRYMYKQHWTSEMADLCYAAINGVYEKVEETDSLKKHLKKLCDHILLESVHLSQLESVKESVLAYDNVAEEYLKSVGALNTTIDSINSLKSDIEKAKSNLKISQEHLEEQQGKIDAQQATIDMQQKEIGASHMQSISILSIFAGVVFAFSGGISLLGNAFSNLPDLTREQSFLFVATIFLIGCILYDVVYLLIHVATTYTRVQRPKLTCLTVLVNLISIIIATLLLGFYWTRPIESESKTNIGIESGQIDDQVNSESGTSGTRETSPGSALLDETI